MKVDLAFATDRFDPPDRLAAWRELVSGEFLPLTITPLTGSGAVGEFTAEAAAHSLGELRVWRLKASPMSAVRAWRHIESAGDGGYLLALHVSGAAQLTHRTIAEIAARWGFRSAAHFTRAFRARYGITPSGSGRR